MRNIFVETSNVKRFMAALAGLEARGANEACLLVVDGAPGLGKTTTLRNWVAQNGCIYLRAQKEWQPRWMLNDLLETMHIHPPHGFEKKYKKAIEELALRQGDAMVARRTFGLVIDEADHITRSEKLIETLRGLSDGIELPIILVGMGKINDNITRFPQVASRVSQRVSFKPASIEDVRALIDARCEVKVADDLATFVRTASGGYNREVLEAIANIERFGLRFDAGDAGVTMADMAGQVLVNDRRSSQPIRVPEAF